MKGEKDDPGLLARYKAMLADLYPGEAVQAPPAIEIDGAPSALGVEFGVVKEGDRWRIPEAFADLASPVLLREAYRAGLPAKTAKVPSMVHACNWFAWKAIDDPALQDRFFKVWLAASQAEKPRDNVYTLPPAYIKEIDKAMPVDARELHGMMVTYAAENERLLGKQLRYDAAEQWALDKAAQLAPVPEPPVHELFYAFASQFVATGDVPSRSNIIDQARRRPRFGGSRGLEDAFAAMSSIVVTALQADVSLVQNKYVHVFFAPSPSRIDTDWDTLFAIPGMYLRTARQQGSVSRVADARGRSLVSTFCVPSQAFEAFSAFIAALGEHGFFEAWQVYTAADFSPSVNFNCYVPGPPAPAYVLDPVRDEPDLFLSTSVTFDADTRAAASFMSDVVREGIAKVKAFIKRVESPFTMTRLQHNSWMVNVAESAGVSVAVARRLFDIVMREHKLFSPDPRCSYWFLPPIQALPSVRATSPANMTRSERERVAKSFPASYSTALRGSRVPDVIWWNFMVPQNEIERAVGIVRSLLPRAHVSTSVFIMGGASLQKGYSLLGWFDGTGFGKAEVAVRRFVDAVPRLATGEYTMSRYVNETATAAEKDYQVLG